MDAAMAKAYAKVNGHAKRSAKESTAAVQAGVAEQARAMGSPYRTSARLRDEDVKATARAEAAKTREIERNERLRDQIRRRIRDATFRKIQTDEESHARRMQRPMRDFGRDASRTTVGGARVVLGAAGEALRGAGLDTSIGGLVGRVVGTETSAIRSTTAGMMGKGKTATAADVAATQAAIKSAGDSTSMSYGAMGGALEAFTAKSSDLEGGKRILTELGQVASATGSDLAELAAGAGAVSQNMTGYGDSAEEAARKAEDLMKIVRLLAKQGSMGSVEIKDLATYMPRLAANANKFTGSYETNVGQLGAIAQMSMKGGRSTAAEATNSAAAFARDLSKPAQLKRFEEAGINVWADEGKTKLRSSSDIISAVYANTGGDQSKISALLRNEMSRSAVNAFSGTYSEAGGGDAGLKAIKKAFETFTTTISASKVKESADLYKNSKAGRVADAQNRAESMMGDALLRVVPALERMAPLASMAADGLAKLGDVAASNPGATIGTAIAASVGKAALGNMLQNIITGGGAAGANASIAKLGAAAAVAAIAWGLAADQLNELTKPGGELDVHKKDQEGQRQTAIENAMRRGESSVEFDGVELAVKGKNKEGKWISETLNKERSDEDILKDRLTTQGALRDHRVQFAAKEEREALLERNKVGSAAWRAANPGVDPNAQGPALGEETTANAALRKGGASFRWGKSADDFGSAGKAFDSAAMDAHLAGIDAKLAGGIRITNLAEIKIPGAPLPLGATPPARPDRTGP